MPTYAPSDTAALKLMPCKLMPWAIAETHDINGIRAVVGSQICAEWWQFGAPEEIRTPDPQIRSSKTSLRCTFQVYAAVRR
jgi:hypothetical protein